MARYKAQPRISHTLIQNTPSAERLGLEQEAKARYSPTQRTLRASHLREGICELSIEEVMVCE
jgi:hypothetical protein